MDLKECIPHTEDPRNEYNESYVQVGIKSMTYTTVNVLRLGLMECFKYEI